LGDAMLEQPGEAEHQDRADGFQEREAAAPCLPRDRAAQLLGANLTLTRPRPMGSRGAGCVRLTSAITLV
jgi:hypothetical protein